MGVSGSDVQRGLRWEPQGIVLYVDENHPNATADADGTDPENPLTTITLAIARLTAFATAMATSLEGSVIVVATEATIAETVIIPVTAPKHCMLLGAARGADAPTWTAATATGIALTIQQRGWTIEGFRFVAGAGGQCIRLDRTNGIAAHRTIVRNNYFDGAYDGLYGINFNGAPASVQIYNNEFHEFTRGDTTAYAIYSYESGVANPYMCVFENNRFWENENHIGNNAAIHGYNLCVFRGNVFHEGLLIAATNILDLRGGTLGKNIVTGNVFCGDYSNTGGYYANAVAPGNWVGNSAEDVAEGEVADNGWTIAPPAV
jgi:hypothetical protein